MADTPASDGAAGRALTHRLHRVRKVTQWASVAIFLVLLTLTVWPLGRVYLGAYLVADPLIAISNAVNGVLRLEMLLALVVLASPLFVGRAVGGDVGPTGTLVELAEAAEPGAQGMPPRLRASHVPERARAVLRAAPTYVLIACAGLLLFGSGAFLFFDPLTTLTRTATVLLYPALDRLVRLAGDVLYLAPPLQGSVDAVTSALTGRLVFAHPLTYGLQLGVLGVFAGMLGLSRLEPRLWCRHLCPLGALLGLVGRVAPLGRVVDADACIHCGRCERVCPLDAVRGDHLATDTSRCQLGLECAAICPTGAIGYGVRPRRELYSPSRRALLGAGTLALLGGFFAFTGIDRHERDVRLVRPPGGRQESDLLALCSRCGQCMKVCPTNVLQPAISRAGLEGVFTPEMDYRVAYCDWSCNECGKVCPTGAIMPLALEVKRTTKIGRAYIDRNRCIPWADYKTCLVCQELCPIPDKAIALREVEVDDPRGGRVKLGRPEVLVERCIGCGICEAACPVPNESAINVRAIAPDRTRAV
jgi:ferredoxin